MKKNHVTARRNLSLLNASVLCLSSFLAAFPFAVQAEEAYPRLVTKNAANQPADSHNTQGCASSQFSSNGRYAMFCSAAFNMGAAQVGEGVSSVYVRDMQTDTLELVSVNTQGEQANGSVLGAHFSADGRYVAFSSTATNIDNRVLGGEGNGEYNTFIRSLDEQTTTLLSVDTDGVPIRGGQGASISSNGNIAVFVGSRNPTFPLDTTFGLYVRNVTTGVTTLVKPNSGRIGAYVSADGTKVVYSEVASGELQTFVSA